MRYITAVLAFAVAAMAMPTGDTPDTCSCGGDGGGSAPTPTMAVPEPSVTAEPGSGDLCPDGLYSNAQCCATDVLGVVGLNCGVPSTTPTDTDDFIATCAETGQQAKCCVIPVADQDLLGKMAGA